MNSCYSVKVDIGPRSLDRGLTTVVQTTEQHLDSDFNSLFVSHLCDLLLNISTKLR